MLAVKNTTQEHLTGEIKLLKEGGASEDDLIAARARYRATSAEYSRFSAAMDLPQQRERVNIDGLGNIGQGKYTSSHTHEDAPQQPQNSTEGNSCLLRFSSEYLLSEPLQLLIGKC